MANGFLIVNREDWEYATPEQRAWMIFNTLQSLDKRLKIIEKKPWIDKICAFMGGIIGGIATVLGIKLGG